MPVFCALNERRRPKSTPPATRPAKFPRDLTWRRRSARKPPRWARAAAL